MLNVSQLLPDLILGRLPNGAGNEEPHIGFRNVVRPLVTGAGQDGMDDLRVALVHLAAVHIEEHFKKI